MAQTGYTPISIYYSATATNTPTAGNLVAGELAINTADGKLFYKDSAGVVQVIGTKGGVGSSSTTQVLYNSSGLVVGSANMTFNGTTLTLANDASISGLTVGKGGGAVSTNTTFGYQAITSNTIGANNVGIGYQAGYGITSDRNTAVGKSALASGSTVTGSDNTAIGQSALASDTSGASNVAVGSYALQANTTASNNTAVGYQSGYSNTTGTDLVAIGYQAAYTSNADQITAIGSLALKANTSGLFNTAVGRASLYANTTGGNNTAVGDGAMVSNTTGSYNTVLGLQALYSNTTASSNTAVGYQAGYYVTGGGNTLLGLGAGSATNNLTTGQNNTLIGQNAGPSASGVNNELVVGSGASFTGKGASTGFINPNGGGVYQGNNSATWSITSDARLKKNIVDNTTGLSAITSIQVRNFEYRTKDEVTELPSQNAIEITGVQLGAIAQELKQILPDCVKTESTGVMSVDTTNLTWYLINAVKELNAKITALENK